MALRKYLSDYYDEIWNCFPVNNVCFVSKIGFKNWSALFKAPEDVPGQLT